MNHCRYVSNTNLPIISIISKHTIDTNDVTKGHQEQYQNKQDCEAWHLKKEELMIYEKRQVLTISSNIFISAAFSFYCPPSLCHCRKCYQSVIQRHCSTLTCTIIKLIPLNQTLKSSSCVPGVFIRTARWIMIVVVCVKYFQAFCSLKLILKCVRACISYYHVILLINNL